MSDESYYWYAVYDSDPELDDREPWYTRLPGWPDADDYSDDPASLLEAVLDYASAITRASGAYAPGERVYAVVWDDGGICAARGSRSATEAADAP